MKYLVLWVAVTMFQVPCPDSQSGKDKYGIENQIHISCAALHMGSKEEQKYAIFTSSQEFTQFMHDMIIVSDDMGMLCIGGYCKNVEVYDLSKSTPIMASITRG